MEFITIVHPNDKRSTQLKRKANSHAARVAHARARKLRVDAYHQQKNRGLIYQKQSSNQTDGPSGELIVQPQHNLQDRQTALAPRTVTISGAFEHEPLASFLKSLTHREHHMFQHYVDTVVPYMGVYCPVMRSQRGAHQHIRRNWVLLCSTDIDLLRGFLLAACRHLSIVQQEKEFVEPAIQYKLSYIRSLRESISDGTNFKCHIAASRAVILTLDEIMLGDLSMAAKHVVGAFHMIQRAGGPDALGPDSLVYNILRNCIYGKRLLDWDVTVRGCGTDFMKPEQHGHLSRGHDTIQ